MSLDLTRHLHAANRNVSDSRHHQDRLQCGSVRANVAQSCLLRSSALVVAGASRSADGCWASEAAREVEDLRIKPREGGSSRSFPLHLLTVPRSANLVPVVLCQAWSLSPRRWERIYEGATRRPPACPLSQRPASCVSRNIDVIKNSLLQSPRPRSPVLAIGCRWSYPVLVHLVRGLAFSGIERLSRMVGPTFVFPRIVVSTSPGGTNHYAFHSRHADPPLSRSRLPAVRPAE